MLVSVPRAGRFGTDLPSNKAVTLITSAGDVVRKEPG
jgi:hypothetical protein